MDNKITYKAQYVAGGEWIIFSNEPLQREWQSYYDPITETSGKLIATSKAHDFSKVSLFDVPDEWLQDDVMKLAERELKNLYSAVPDKQSEAMLYESFHRGFYCGKKYKFTEKDIIKAVEYGQDHYIKRDVPEEYLQSIQQPKQRKEYEVELEMEGVCCSPLSGGIRHHDSCDECDQYTEQIKITEGKVKILSWK